jgi:hypothetical protein
MSAAAKGKKERKKKNALICFDHENNDRQSF